MIFPDRSEHQHVFMPEISSHCKAWKYPVSVQFGYWQDPEEALSNCWHGVRFSTKPCNSEKDNTI